jgi:hypothetical protein
VSDQDDLLIVRVLELLQRLQGLELQDRTRLLSFFQAYLGNLERAADDAAA